MIGATLCKGLNRGLGTLLAGSLAFLFEFIARESGKVFYAIFIGASVFFIGKQGVKKRCLFLFSILYHLHIDINSNRPIPKLLN